MYLVTSLIVTVIACPRRTKKREVIDAVTVLLSTNLATTNNVLVFLVFVGR